MSEVTEPVKKKRRRRLKTPPPEDQLNSVGDYYDSVVSQAFREIKSDTQNIDMEKELEAIASSKSAAAAQKNQLHQDVVLLDENGRNSQVLPWMEIIGHSSSLDADGPIILDEQPLSPGVAEALLEFQREENNSPPPPVYMPSKAPRLGNGVSAALKRLEAASINISIDMAQSAVMESYEDQVRALCNAQDVMITSENPTSTTLKLLVKLDSKYERMELSVTDKLSVLKNKIASEKSVSADRIMLFLNDNYLEDDDTPLSLGLTVADTVEAVITPEGHSLPQKDNNSQTADGITIKVQGRGGQRDVVSLIIKPTDTLELLMQKYAEVKELTDVSGLTFRFDGEEVSLTDTPSDLDIDDGDCVDVVGL